MPTKIPNQSHAWRGSWNRPMHLDEDSLHPFDVARMTDHNVRGGDKDETFDEGSPSSQDLKPRRLASNSLRNGMAK